MANLYRPGNHAGAVLVALGTGVMFTLSIYLRAAVGAGADRPKRAAGDAERLSGQHHRAGEGRAAGVA